MQNYERKTNNKWAGGGLVVAIDSPDSTSRNATFFAATPAGRLTAGFNKAERRVQVSHQGVFYDKLSLETRDFHLTATAREDSGHPQLILKGDMNVLRSPYYLEKQDAKAPAQIIWRALQELFLQKANPTPTGLDAAKKVVTDLLFSGKNGFQNIPNHVRREIAENLERTNLVTDKTLLSAIASISNYAKNTKNHTPHYTRF